MKSTTIPTNINSTKRLMDMRELLMAGSRNKESAEPRHCSGTPTKAQRNSARPAPFRVRPSTASSGYKSLAAQVRRFPEAELDSRLSLRIVTAATLSGHGLCSVRSPGLEFVGSATYRSSLASLSSESTVYQHRRPKSMTRRHLFCTRAHPAESFRTDRLPASSSQIDDTKASVLYAGPPCGVIPNWPRDAIFGSDMRMEEGGNSCAGPQAGLRARRKPTSTCGSQKWCPALRLESPWSLPGSGFL